MYPPTAASCSSSDAPSGAVTGTDTTNDNLTRYCSAPSSLLTAAGYFSCDTDTESKLSNKTSTSISISSSTGLQRSNYCFNNPLTQFTNTPILTHHHSSPLIRHKSSPAAFLNRLASASSAFDNVSRELEGGCDSDSARRGISRLNSQLSFTKDCLSQITEESNREDNNIGHRRNRASDSYAAVANYLEMGSWDNTNAVMFSSSPSKRAKSVNTSDISNAFSNVGSQLHFGPAETTVEMAMMENLINIPQDSTPCKVRAKRGFATHPRSIAERDRRSRISGKLKKLQDLVPNMDKQTSYADMLDLAVEHIKVLQTQLQKLHKETENCTCGCGENT